ncbi:MAG: TerC family protein [Bacteroidia bacterium]|nr:TerC family protein [Bacteroidia bacterium]
MIHNFILFLVLSGLELVLGVDNVIFISLVIAKLPQASRLKVRIIAMSLALGMRIAMLWALVMLSKITYPLFVLSNFAVSTHDILFLAGGMFLIWSAATELYNHLSGRIDGKQAQHEAESTNGVNSIRRSIIQVVLIDMLFSFDSIFTAIGITQNIIIMVSAIICGMACMFWLSSKIAWYINRHRNLKTIALIFIILVGLSLFASSIHFVIPEIWLYVALAAGLMAQLIPSFTGRKK